MVKNLLTQHYKNAKQIRDVPSFNKSGFSAEKPEENRFSEQRVALEAGIKICCLYYLREKSNVCAMF